MVKTTCPSVPIRMNALGTKPLDRAAAAPRPANGNWRLSTKPPPAAAAARRNLRREKPIADPDCSACARSTLSMRVIVGLRSLYGLLDGFANAHIGPAAADVAGHGTVDFGIRRMWVAREQRRGRHDLARLAVPALHDFALEPCLLNLAANRRRPDRLDGRDV